MKKLVIFTFLFLSTLLVNANPIYASEIINQPKDKKVINIIDNKDIQSVNSKLEKTRVITQKNLAEIKELSNVKINKSDNKKVELFIENKKPDRIVEYDDGSKVAYYASSIVYCN